MALAFGFVALAGWVAASMVVIGIKRTVWP